MLVDTHCHLNMRDFRDDLDAVLGRAAAAGVEKMVVVGTTLADSRRAVELAAAHPGRIHATVGVHPHHASSVDDTAIAELRRLAGCPGVVAIGETGLDWYRDRSPRPDQRAAFARQTELALELGLPLVIHSRESLEDCDAALAASGGYGTRVVMHCFTGHPEWVAAFRDRGCWLSLGGPVTYPKADDARQVAGSVPDGRLMLETDSPLLAPQSSRGRRCEPAHVREVAETVARVRGVSFDELLDSTGAAAAAFFGWER